MIVLVVPVVEIDEGSVAGDNVCDFDSQVLPTTCEVRQHLG
jgi:hypothetical protein